MLAVSAGLEHSLALRGNGMQFIAFQPKGQTNYSGTTVSFSVMPGGSSLPLSFQWRWNGNNILGATNRSLALANVQTTSAGNYSVVVSSSAGSVTSSNAALAVINQSPILTSVPANQAAWAGSAVTFRVSATGSLPLSYQWQLNATDLVNQTNAALALNNVQPANAGVYRCLVSNPYGSTNVSASLTLIGSGELEQPAWAWTSGGNAPWLDSRSRILQRFQCLERGQHAIHAVEAPAGRLAVHV